MNVWNWIAQLLKKLFAPERARFYLYVSVLFMAGCGVAVGVVIILHGSFLRLPVDAMSISSVPRVFLYIGLAFGAMAMLSWPKVNISIVVSFIVAGFFLVTIFNVYAKILLSVVGYREEKGSVMVVSVQKRDYHLGFGVVVVESVCISNDRLVDVYNVTKIYEQDGMTHKKKWVGPDALKPGQVIDITYSSFGDDDEFFDLLRTKFPPYGLDITLWEGAAEITIHKGEYRPRDLKTGFNLCESLFGK